MNKKISEESETQIEILYDRNCANPNSNESWKFRLSKFDNKNFRTENNIFIPPITTDSTCFLTPNIFRSPRQQRTFPEFSLFHTCCNGKNQPRIPANSDLKPFSISAMVRRRKTLFLIRLCTIFKTSTKNSKLQYKSLFNSQSSFRL